MLLAEVTLPYWNPEITSGSITLVVTIVTCAVGLGWWFTRQFSAAQVMFSSLQKDVNSIQAEMAQVKIDQAAQFAAVNLELKHQTEILRKQDVMAERLSNEGKRLDSFEQRLQKLDDAFSHFRVGSAVSSQRQVG